MRRLRTARTLAVAVTALAVSAATTLAYADGIDISHWQGSVNWTKVKHDDISFAFMKATEGTNYTDPTLSKNWNGAENVGIYRAAYHFARPSTAKGSASAQAHYFVSKTGTYGDKGDLPPVLDLEATGGLSASHLRSWVKTWLETTQKLTGRTPMIYVSPYFWIDNLGNSTAFTKYPLWIAHYTTGQPKIPGGWKTWTFWQHTSSGHVDGIGGKVDMNEFNGSSKQLAAIANSSGGSDDPAPTGPTLPAGAATKLTVTPSSTAPARGQQVTFSGSLVKSTTGFHVRGRAVTLWNRPVGWKTWRQVGTGKTDGDGRYSMPRTPRSTADYQVRFASDKKYAASVSPVVRVVGVPLTAVALDLRREGATVQKGTPLTIYGHLTSGGKALTGRTVRYYKRFPGGGSWQYVGEATSVAPTGWHSIVIRPQVDRYYKAVFTGDATYENRRSRYLKVSVD